MLLADWQWKYLFIVIMIVGIIFGNFKFDAPKVVKFNFFNNFYKLLNSVPLRQTYPNIVPHILAQKMKEIRISEF